MTVYDMPSDKVAIADINDQVVLAGKLVAFNDRGEFLTRRISITQGEARKLTYFGRDVLYRRGGHPSSTAAGNSHGSTAKRPTGE